MNKLFYTIIASVSLIFLVVCINLNSRINDLTNKCHDLEWTVQEHELSIQRMAEKNTMQDTREYQMREHERAQKLKEIAEQNGVGG